MKLLATTLSMAAGLVVIVAAKAAGYWTAKQIIHSDRGGLPVMGAPFTPNFNTSAFNTNSGGFTYKAPIIPVYRPVDTRAGQRLTFESAQRNIDRQIRAAQNAVPVQRSVPGVPRF